MDENSNFSCLRQEKELKVIPSDDVNMADVHIIKEHDNQLRFE